MPRQNNNPNRAGVTLIELIITIAIIGILASFAVYSFSGIQRNARDNQRKSDLDQVKKALELTRQDCTGGAFYPWVPDNGGTEIEKEEGRYSNLQSYLSNQILKYMGEVPQDTKNSDPYLYRYNVLESATSVCPDTSAVGVKRSGSTDFMLRAKLENASDPDITNSFTKCSGKPGFATIPITSPDGFYYVCND